jgi:hypothetical protein
VKKRTTTRQSQPAACGTSLAAHRPPRVARVPVRRSWALRVGYDVFFFKTFKNVAIIVKC